MNVKSLTGVATRLAGRNVLRLKKNAPHIAFGAGIVTMVGTVVLSSRATLRVHDLLDEHERTLTVIDKARETKSDYTDRDRKADTVTLYIQTGGKLAKLYAPAVLLGGVSIACLTGAHLELNKRNAGLVAAYATVDKAFKSYRERVVNEYGEGKDRELLFGVEEYSEVKPTKDGKGKKVKSQRVAGHSMYARFFDENNVNYNQNPETNLLWLKAMQASFTTQLRTKGHVFLNEVYDALGLERTVEGAVVGWVDTLGDGFVDFGFMDEDRTEQFIDFMTGREGALLLDFNVYGTMYDKI